MAKRIMDLTICLGALPILLPLLLICALAVKFTSPGPILFRQKRLGQNGRAFEMFKFRSMYVNAPDLRNSDGSTFNAERDPRVTSAGKWLRKSSLDELPQLFNILLGDMSIVGPRPDLPDHMLDYRPQDHGRLRVRPGITGWAQIHGRNSLPLEIRRNYDLEYIARVSVWLDLQIILRTIPVVLVGKGVYLTTSEEHSAK